MLQGKELSFTNLLDLDSAARIALEFTEPAAAVIKHTNPCGAAIGLSIEEAYVRAREADPLAAFGGIIGLNRPIDAATARALVSTFIEAVIAPGVDEEARPILAAKANMRVVIADLDTGDDAREPARGALDTGGDAGAAARRSDRGALAVEREDLRGRGPEGRDEARAERGGMGRAAFCLAHLRAREIERGHLYRCVAHAGDRCGADEPRRRRAGGRHEGDELGGKKSLAGSVAASDAFFPFRDGLDALAKAGATAVVQPGGSLRDSEVIAAADEHGLAMVFTGKRHFRH